MEITKSWWLELSGDNIGVSESIKPYVALSPLNFLEASATILRQPLELPEKLTEWASLVLEFCHPIGLELSINLAESLMQQTKPLYFQLYQGQLKFSADLQNFKIRLALPDIKAIAFRPQFSVGCFGQLRLLINRELAEQSEVYQALSLATNQLEAFLAKTNLERELAERQQAEALQMALLEQANHDLRGPFGSLTLAADLLLEKGLDLPATEVRYLLQRLKRNVAALNGMLEHYLNLPRLSPEFLSRAPILEVVVIKEHLQKVMDIALPQLERKEQSLVLDLADAPEPVVMADEHYFDQILLNLVYNAHKHTPGLSEIKIQVRAQPPYLQISVIDNGSGVDPELLPQLEKLFSSDLVDPDKSPKLGLGLKLIHDLTLKQGGLAGFSSSSTGSVFWVKLQLPQ